LYEDQNELLWDTELIKQGSYFLSISAQGNEICSYHLEAAIAFHHCSKDDTKEKWEEILQLYNRLLIINYSPAVALNRTYALYKANGQKAALAEALKLKLDDNHFYHMLLGELYKGLDNDKAVLHLKKAAGLAGTDTEKQLILNKLSKYKEL